MRPPDPVAKVDGTHYEAIEEDLADWRAIDPEHARPCRQRVGQAEDHRTCKEPSVLAMDRGRRTFTAGRISRRSPSWWHYCARHAFGRWVEDGKVFHWRLVEDATP